MSSMAHTAASRALGASYRPRRPHHERRQRSVRPRTVETELTSDPVAS